MGVGPSFFPFLALKWLFRTATAGTIAADGSDLAPAGTGHFILLDALPYPVDGYRWHANEGDDQQEPIGVEDIHAGSLVCLGCLSQVFGLQGIDSVDVSAGHALVALIASRVLPELDHIGRVALRFWTQSPFVFWPEIRKQQQYCQEEQAQAEQEDGDFLHVEPCRPRYIQ